MARVVRTRSDRGAARHVLAGLMASVIVTLLASCTADLDDRFSGPPTGDEAVASSDSPTPMFGAYTYGGVWHGMAPVLAVEEALGRKLDVVHWFMNFQHAYDPLLVQAVMAGGRTPLISWQPVNSSVAAIAAGDHDAYLRRWARGIRDAPGRVYLRPFPEMNGEWTSWNGDPASLRAAWRRMAALFDAEGADNVRWVFSPNVTDEPRTEANRLEHYYPGGDVVDVLALDGYNWGASQTWSQWTSFEELFAPGYARITALGPQPVWFAELASAEVGGDKAAWVSEMFAEARAAFPRLEALIWFDEDKEADWRLASAPDVLAAFRDALATDAVLGDTAPPVDDTSPLANARRASNVDAAN